MTPYLIVTGDFVQTGGMDHANYELALYLAERNTSLHLVAHRVSDQITQFTNVHPHLVRKPLSSYLLGSPLLDRQGRIWAKHVTTQEGRVIVNGGNCQWGDVNWVHYVHAAYHPVSSSGWLYAGKVRLTHELALKSERNSLRQARLIICNSERTRRDLLERLRLPEERLRVIYYGIDPDRFQPATIAAKETAKTQFGFRQDRPLAIFIGALGDRRKGFDVLFAAWALLCKRKNWECDLVVIGAGMEFSAWQARAKEQGLSDRIRFLGFRKDVSMALAAADLLIHPARYEAYGLGVHEALCCGLPALVTRSAGVAERFPSGLQELLLDDPPAVNDLIERLRYWQANRQSLAAQSENFSAMLRKETWSVMANRIIDQVERSY